MVTGEGKKILLLPPLPPLNLPGLRRSGKISATTPPPTESGRPPETTENWPPPKKILATPLHTHTHTRETDSRIVSRFRGATDVIPR